VVIESFFVWVVDAANIHNKISAGKFFWIARSDYLPFPKRSCNVATANSSSWWKEPEWVRIFTLKA